MSVSCSVSFNRKPDDPEWMAKLNVVRALEHAKIEELPQELMDYFGISSAYVSTALEKLCVSTVWMDAYRDMGCLPDGVDLKNLRDSNVLFIDLDELPKDIRMIKVSLG